MADTVAGYRLATPVGYWNGLGLVAAMAMLLAVGLVVEERWIVPRLLAGGSLPVLASTLYFTFSRGAWIALGAGLLALVALSPRRLRFLTAIPAFAAPTVLAVALSYHARPLRLLNIPLARAVGSGHDLAWKLALTILLGLIVAAFWVVLSPRVDAPDAVRLCIRRRARSRRLLRASRSSWCTTAVPAAPSRTHATRSKEDRRSQEPT